MKRSRSPSEADIEQGAQDAEHALNQLLREFPCMEVHISALRQRSSTHLESLRATMRAVFTQLRGADAGDK